MMYDTSKRFGGSSLKIDTRLPAAIGRLKR
jgi:hypothetical protein